MHLFVISSKKKESCKKLRYGFVFSESYRLLRLLNWRR